MSESSVIAYHARLRPPSLQWIAHASMWHPCTCYLVRVSRVRCG